MKRLKAISICVLGVVLGGARLQGQIPSGVGTKPAAVTAQSSAAADDDRFPALRENAERLKAEYEKIDTKNMDDIDQLLKSRRCQITRVGGMLDRTIQAMDSWHEAESTYWKKWAEVEQDRIDGQKKTLAEMEVDQQRAKEAIDSEAADREELLRKKANLEKTPKRTQDIIHDIDALILDIKDSESRLDEAQKQYEDVTAKVNNMNAAITARVIDMRQN